MRKNGRGKGGNPFFHYALSAICGKRKALIAPLGGIIFSATENMDNRGRTSRVGPGHPRHHAESIAKNPNSAAIFQSGRL